MSERGRLTHEHSPNTVWFTRLACGQTCALKVGVTRSFHTRQMLKVDLCANEVGANVPYAPLLPTGLLYGNFSLLKNFKQAATTTAGSSTCSVGLSPPFVIMRSNNLGQWVRHITLSLFTNISYNHTQNDISCTTTLNKCWEC